jgi:hypothetical protein
MKMTMKVLKCFLPGLIAALVCVFLSGCASTSTRVSGRATPDDCLVMVGRYYFGDLSVDSVDLKLIDGKPVNRKTGDILPVSPGVREFTAGIYKSRMRPAKNTFTLEPGGYYILTVNGFGPGGFKRLERIETELGELTYPATHGYGSVYSAFVEAEKKLGRNTLVNGVGRLRLDKKDSENDGVYDLSVSLKDQVTLEIEEDIIIHKFDDDDLDLKLSWGSSYGDKYVRIPPGRHTMVIEYYRGKSGYRAALNSSLGVFSIGAVIGTAIGNKRAETTRTGDIKLEYEFYPGATYKLKGVKDKTRKGSYRAVEVIPGKGAPKNQQRGFGSSLLASPEETETVQVAAVPPPLPQASGGQYFVSTNDGQPGGPYTFDEIKQQIQKGQIKRETLVWKEGMPQWVSAETVKELDAAFLALPPPLPPR